MSHSAVLSQLLNGILIQPLTEQHVGTRVIGKVPGGQHPKKAVLPNSHSG